MSKQEKKFTLEQAKEQLIKEQKEAELDRQKRIKKFIELLKQVEEETNCTIRVDLNSALNDIKLIVISAI
jgi:hypothetical protein